MPHTQSNAIGGKAENHFLIVELLAKHAEKIQTLPFATRVPESLAITQKEIITHLDEYACGWRSVWSQFQFHFSRRDVQGMNHNLLELRNRVWGAFNVFEFFCKRLEDFVQSLIISDPSVTLAVRSSANEDKADVANPGGNASIPAVLPNRSSISNALGQVIASYFSEKSIHQRAASDDQIALAEPEVSVFLQRMISEKDAHLIVSGIMHVDETIRIEAAPGHGELNANGLAPADVFEITPKGNVYSQIAIKTQRLVPANNQLQWQGNDYETRNEPCLPIDVVRGLGAIGRLCQRDFDFNNVEFVYQTTPGQTGQLYLVQARKMQTKATSGIASTIEVAKKQELIALSERFELEIIVNIDNAARVITEPKYILCCQTAEHALAILNQQFDTRVRVVVVADATVGKLSHALAQLSAQNILVVKSKQMLLLDRYAKRGKPLIFDPQGRQVFCWLTVVPEHLEYYLYQKGFLKKGLFKTANALQPTSARALSNNIADTLYQDVLTLMRSNRDRDYRINTWRDIVMQIEHLEAVQPGAEHESQTPLAILFNALMRLSHLKQFGSYPYRQLAQTSFVILAEINSYYKTGLSVANRGTLLNLSAMLTNIFTRQTRDKTLSESFPQRMADQKTLKQMATSDKIIPPEYLLYLPSFFHFEQFAFTREHKLRWSEFVKTVLLENSANHIALQQILHFCHRYDLSTDWFHQRFIALSQTMHGSSLLECLVDELKKTENVLARLSILTVQPLLVRWSVRVKEWSLPDNAEPLWYEFTEVIDCIPILTTQVGGNVLVNIILLRVAHSWVELLDQTIKAVTSSYHYNHDLRKKYQYFLLLLKPFMDFMLAWLEKIPESVYREWKKDIEWDSISKYEMMEFFNDFLIDKTVVYSVENEFIATEAVYIPSLRVDCPASFDRQKKSLATTEDFFSLVHQNNIACLTYFLKSHGVLQYHLPSFIKVWQTSLEGILVTHHREGIIYSNSPKCIMLEQEQGVIHLHYQLALKNHSMKFVLRCDLQNQFSHLVVELYGYDSDLRMTRILMLADFEGAIFEAVDPTFQPGNYNVCKRFSWRFTRPLSERDHDKIVCALTDYAHLTFRGHYCTEAMTALVQNPFPAMFARHDFCEKIVSAYHTLPKHFLRLFGPTFINNIDSCSVAYCQFLPKLFVKHHSQLNQTRLFEAFFTKNIIAVQNDITHRPNITTLDHNRILFKYLRACVFPSTAIFNEMLRLAEQVAALFPESRHCKTYYKLVIALAPTLTTPEMQFYQTLLKILYDDTVPIAELIQAAILSVPPIPQSSSWQGRLLTTLHKVIVRHQTSEFFMPLMQAFYQLSHFNDKPTIITLMAYCGSWDLVKTWLFERDGAMVSKDFLGGVVDELQPFITYKPALYRFDNDFFKKYPAKNKVLLKALSDKKTLIVKAFICNGADIDFAYDIDQNYFFNAVQDNLRNCCLYAREQLVTDYHSYGFFVKATIGPADVVQRMQTLDSDAAQLPIALLMAYVTRQLASLGMLKENPMHDIARPGFRLS